MARNGRPARPLAERFADKVSSVDIMRGDGLCWNWTGYTRGGYGHISSANGNVLLAHRAAYELTYGLIPAGLCVLHTCDNPSCVRPLHLRLGTHRENSADMVAKKRQHSPTGERNTQAKLTDAQAAEIISRYASGELQPSLAHAFGVTQSTVSRIASGKRRANA